MYPQYTNPVNDFYIRQAQYQPQINFPPQQNMPVINSKFVTSIDEARASMIDGFSYNIFLDSSSGRIYLKKLNNNGTSDFIVYSIEEKKESENDPMKEINLRLSNIETAIGGIVDAKSISSNSINEKPQSVFKPEFTKQNESNDATESTGISKDAGNDKWQKRR